MPGYFNPLPPHGGRRYQDIMYDRNRNISIHSLRMEGDSTKRKQQELDRKISIHSLRMEGDIKETPKTSMKSFQSTPSAWRETIGVVETVTPIWDFNPLPPHGGRRTFLLMLLLHRTFQSTPSAWRETIMYFVSKMEKLISIHSLRMEGDHIFESVLCEISNFNPLPPHGGRPYGSRVIQCPLNFNPLPPHGGRRKTTCGMSTQAAFQSTPSAWRETALN